MAIKQEKPRWQTDGKDCQNLPFQKVLQGLARNGGHGEQPAGGQLWRVTGRNGQPNAPPQPEAQAALLLPRQELWALLPRGPTLRSVAFVPILQLPGTPPLKSLPQIIKLEVRNADTPS